MTFDPSLPVSELPDKNFSKFFGKMKKSYLGAQGGMGPWLGLMVCHGEISRLIERIELYVQSILIKPQKGAKFTKLKLKRSNVSKLQARRT